MGARSRGGVGHTRVFWSAGQRSTSHHDCAIPVCDPLLLLPLLASLDKALDAAREPKRM